MEDQDTKVNIVVLDACRDDPFGKRSGSGGMASITPPEGSVIIFAAGSGQTAGDGTGEDGHGLFTGSLLRHMELHAHEPLLDLANKVRLDVYNLSGEKQKPQVITALIGQSEKLMLDGNIAKTTVSGSSNGQQDDRTAALEAENKKLMKEANPEKAQKSEAAKVREKQGEKGEKDRAEADAKASASEGRKKAAASRRDKMAAETQQAADEVAKMAQEEKASREQVERLAQLEEQRKLVAQLKEEIQELVQNEKYEAVVKKKKGLTAAEGKLRELERVHSCSAGDGSCSAGGEEAGGGGGSSTKVLLACGSLALIGLAVRGSVINANPEQPSGRITRDMDSLFGGGGRTPHSKSPMPKRKDDGSRFPGRTTGRSGHGLIGSPMPKSFLRSADDAKVITWARQAGSSARWVNLSGNHKVTDVGITELARCCTGLENIDLSNCTGLENSKVTDAGITELARSCTGLKSIVLARHDKITDAGIIELARGCTGLERINLYGCDKVTDAGITELARGCTGLESIGLSYCDKVTDTGIAEFKRTLPNCRITH
jgi:hypothetical protein